MAAELTCDFCREESAVLMMTDLVTGTVVTVGAACLPMFFGGAHIGSIGSPGHAGPPTKCQACRAIHDQMTTPVAQLAAAGPAPDNAAGNPESPYETELAE